jgi:hypothetical protein
VLVTELLERLVARGGHQGFDGLHVRALRRQRSVVGSMRAACRDERQAGREQKYGRTFSTHEP